MDSRSSGDEDEETRPLVCNKISMGSHIFEERLHDIIVFTNRVEFENIVSNDFLKIRSLFVAEVSFSIRFISSIQERFSVSVSLFSLLFEMTIVLVSVSMELVLVSVLTCFPSTFARLGGEI